METELHTYPKENTYNFIAGKRDMIIFGNGYYEELYNRGIRYFEKLRTHELCMLMEAKLFDPYPWARYMEYVWFMKTGGVIENLHGADDKLFLHGFVYSPERKEEWGRQNGIVIEGIGRDESFGVDDRGQEAMRTFIYLFGRADQFDTDPPWVWDD